MGPYHDIMNMDDDACYRALTARDARFDGVFFVGVTSTYIYCRPVCSARTPRRENCRFFPHAAAAERAGFRPCLRCRPELAPGQAPVDVVGRTARLAAARIEAGALNGDGGLETLAKELGLSSRQLRRVVRKELGASPVELAQTARLLLAKRLLGESRLPVIRVAFASGFESVRRFNALFRSHYGLTPTRVRRAAPAALSRDCLRLTLAYRPPFAWEPLLRFLAGRATAGVEAVVDNSYRRTVHVAGRSGWLSVKPLAGRNALAVELAASLTPVLPAVLGRLRDLFDLNARPDVIAAHLSADPGLAPLVVRRPGLRAPGAFDGFELAVRAVLGQRVSVKAATTLAGRLAAAFGEPVETPFPALNRLTPTAEHLAAADESALRALGITAARAACLVSLARAAVAMRIVLEPSPNPETEISRLQECAGIGEWTAQYIALRALRWPDAFPAGDLGLLKAAGAASPRALRTASATWRPWRAYAAMHLWESLYHDPNNNDL
jgi:AraC family transcriptional regulator, regulatory protein of adaptative response / DNA-3-methyladenine glycosylase II